MFVLQQFVIDVDWSRCRTLKIHTSDPIFRDDDPNTNLTLLPTLARAMNRFSGLTSLDYMLPIYRPDDAQASAVIDCVLRLPCLQRLLWYNYSFSRATCEQFVASLHYATRLDTLSLTMCEFEHAADVARVVDSLNNSASQLQQLDLSSIIRVTDKRCPRAVAALAAALERNTTLRDLSLGDSGDAHSLLQAISRHSLLTRLAFDKSSSESSWNGQQIDALRAFVTSSPRLRVLKLPGKYDGQFPRKRQDRIVESLFVIAANRSAAPLRFEPDSLHALYCDAVGRQHRTVIEVCIGLQSLELPAFVTLAIVDVLLEGERCALVMNTKWNWIVTVKHFREHSKR